MTRLLLLAPLILATTAAAQPRATAESRRAVATDTTTSDFEVNGLHVILRRNTATDVVAANLYLLGGARQLTPRTQGIEALLFAASERGSRQYPGPKLRQELARVGSIISVSLSEDWSTYSLKAIRSTFDTSWAIFTDRLLAPTLTQSDVDLVRSQMVTNAQRADFQPEALLHRLADSVTFSGHPYGMATEGTAESLAGLGPTHLREYMQRTFVTSRMLLVVVGNVDRQKVEQLVRTTIASLPKGDYQWTAPPPLGGRKATVVRQAALPTNYILGYYAGPPAGTEDYNALRLATAVLSGRFFTEIRSKRSLSYAADAPFVERATSTGGVYVTTVDPNAALTVMRNEISRLQTELIDREGLDRLIEQFITEYFLKNETNSDQASFLARAAIYQGDYRAAERFVSDLRRVSPSDIRQAARTYIRNFSFAYVGDPARLDRALLDRF
ncbi:MAG TPA: pitrilysin family protein [Gemmatimonadaceae bacterium]|nr:pitrilysin family protein [Gemmatimonadaceae bacterium]